MRILLPVLVLILLSNSAFSQLDSTKLHSSYDSLKLRANALQQKLSSKSDSIPNPLTKLQNNQVKDTLTYLNSRIDSIQHGVNTRIDSIQNIYTQAVTSAQHVGQKFKTKIDSLQKRNLPTDKYTAKMDSVQQKVASLQNNLGQKVEGVKKQATDKINKMDFPPELKDKANKLTGSIQGLGPQTLQANLPENLKLDQLNLLKTPAVLQNASSLPGVNLPDVPGVTQKEIPDIANGVKDVPGMDQVTDTKGKAGELTGKADEIAKMKPQSIDKAVESKAGELSQVQEINKQAANLPTAKSEEEMKAELKKQAQAVAVDHFAGKEQQLKAAMEKIAKYKKKYPSVTSIADVAKKPKNPMHGKPLRERIVPGIGMQIQKKGEMLLVDFNPYVGFRFTGRITAGPGWNQRIAYDLDRYRFKFPSIVYGPRIFGEFKIGKGFSPRAEVEWMHTVVPPSVLNPSVDPQHNEWVWGVFTGIKKDYKIFKNIKGTASVMMRLFDPHHKSPYADVVNARFGFEFPMKKHPKSKTKKSRS